MLTLFHRYKIQKDLAKKVEGGTQIQKSKQLNIEHLKLAYKISEIWFQRKFKVGEKSLTFRLVVTWKQFKRT